jgi:hypothetical protein
MGRGPEDRFQGIRGPLSSQTGLLVFWSPAHLTPLKFHLIEEVRWERGGPLIPPRQGTRRPHYRPIGPLRYDIPHKDLDGQGTRRPEVHIFLLDVPGPLPGGEGTPRGDAPPPPLAGALGRRRGDPDIGRVKRDSRVWGAGEQVGEGSESRPQGVPEWAS